MGIVATTGPGVGRPTTVRYNDWTKVHTPPEEYEPSCPVSVVVPCFEAPNELARTLAALEGQSYPGELFEVIVVDDASDPPLELPSSPLDVRLVRQEGAGFGLARARNSGARVAAHEILVFLDGDMLAEKELLAAHARWHHSLSDALTFGMYRRVSVDGVSVSMVRGRTGSISSLLGDRASDPSPLAEYIDKANGLNTKRDDIFRAASGGNLALRKRFFDEIGGFDETFTQYGGEDTEFAYRAYTLGALLVPASEAMAWHQGRLNESREKKERDAAVQLGKLANLMAHEAYRRAVPGRSYLVPEYVVTIRAGAASKERVLDIAETILGGTVHDLVVRIEVPDREDERSAWLASRLQGEPRVYLSGPQSGLDEFPAAPFHVVVEAGADIHRDLIGSLRHGLGSGVVGKVPLPPGAQVSIARAWALRRAQRTGLDVEEFGDAAVIDVRSRALRVRLWLRRVRRILSAAPYRTGWRDVLRRASFTRPRDLAGFVRWVFRGIGARLSEIVGGKRRETRPKEVGRALGSVTLPRSSGSKALAPLGVEIATLGIRAARVFAGCRLVSGRSAGDHVDFVIADTPSEATSFVAPAVVLSETPKFAVPAFDPGINHPVGWARDVDYVVGSLGSRRLLPSGVTAHRVVGHNDIDSVRLCHHLVDVAAFHTDEIERAGVLVRLAATGAPVFLADGGPGLDALIGNELHALMTTEIQEADTNAREVHSIKMRRLALREHSFRSRARQLSEAALDDPPDVASVSILLPTKRPDLLGWAVDNVARQTYPRLQLVLALHGDQFDTATVERVVRRLRLPASVVRVGGNRTLGSVLNAAVQEASGTLLTKMDDDDLYGPDHIWDLVLAHEYSGAQLVGKIWSTVYLAHRHLTLRQFRSEYEMFNRSIAGGAMLISRHDLDHVGGWQRVPSREDVALRASVLRNGGSIYRTHGLGYLVVRHGEAHTWSPDDSEFLDGDYAAFPGWQPAVADIENAPELPYSFRRTRG